MKRHGEKIKKKKRPPGNARSRGGEPGGRKIVGGGLLHKSKPKRNSGGFLDNFLEGTRKELKKTRENDRLQKICLKWGSLERKGAWRGKGEQYSLLGYRVRRTQGP